MVNSHCYICSAIKKKTSEYDRVFFLFSDSTELEESSSSHRLAKRQASVTDKRVVCYFANWSVYRTGTAKFTPQNINPYLCTHLIYAFGGLGKDDTIQPFDKYQDLEKGNWAVVTHTHARDGKKFSAGQGHHHI